MLPRIRDVLNVLEEMAPLNLAESWDNAGLQLGSLQMEVRGILVALDPTLGAVEKAKALGTDLLLTHHPLFFGKVTSLETGQYPGDVAALALREDIAIASWHTNLDAALGGLSDILAEALGLREVEVLMPTGIREGAGLGRVGSLPEPRSLERLCSEVKDILGVAHLKGVGQKEQRVRRLAVVAGSGGGLVSEAHAVGADGLLTGDVSHHHALLARSLGVALVDAGHFGTERAAFRGFAKRLNRDLHALGWDLRVLYFEEEQDPLWRI